MEDARHKLGEAKDSVVSGVEKLGRGDVRGAAGDAGNAAKSVWGSGWNVALAAGDVLRGGY